MVARGKLGNQSGFVITGVIAGIADLRVSGGNEDHASHVGRAEHQLFPEMSRICSYAKKLDPYSQTHTQ